MNERQNVQYTIRGISANLDRCIRERAVREKRSLNETAVLLLERAAGMSAEVVRHTDLDHLAGTWVDDPAFDDAVAQLHRVEPGLWK